MIYINVILTVRNSSDVMEIRELLKRQGELSRAEPGCLRFEVYQSRNDANVFILNEHWASQAELDAHRLAEAYTTIYVPHVIPRIDRIPHPSDLVQ